MRTSSLRARAWVTSFFVLLASLTLAVVVPTASAQDPSRKAEVLAARYIVVFDKSVGRPGALTTSLERETGFRAHARYSSALKGFAARLAPEQLERLRRHPLVDLAVSDRPVRAVTSVALTSGDSVPPGMRRIGAATATSVRRASTANVAVLDSGIDLAHPDLNAADGANCVGTGPATDDDGHGTHVAGTIGARNNGSGVTGVAPGTRVSSVEVLDASGSGSWASIICGLDWVTATLTDGDPTNDMRVVNMSLGGFGPPVEDCAITTDALHLAVCRATSAGAVVVVAAGNDSWDFDYPAVPDVPAAYPEVLTVTAMTDTDGKPGGLGSAPGCSPGDRDDYYASFSNFAATTGGEAHTIAAPGTCIRSTIPGGYATWSGTSMATPHVAGLVALCMSEGTVSGPCANKTAPDVIAHMREAARLRSVSSPGSGFVGDSDRPFSGVHFGRLVWAGAVTPPSVASAPTTVSLQSGSLSSGGAPSLTTDDDNFLKVSSTTSGTRTTAWVGSFTGIPNEAKSLRVAFKGATSASCSHTLAMWRWTTSSWTSIDSRTLGTSEALVDKLVSGSAANHISGTSGNGEVRVRVRCTKSSNFVTRTDLLRLTRSF